MATLLIKQSVRGNFCSFEVDASVADIAIIQGLMAGIVSTFGLKSFGGTDVPTPATLRSVKLGVNRKLDRLSATVNIKNMKATKHISDLFADKALFDADYVSTLSATGIRAIYEGSK